jgi:hypothetical protein
MTDLDHQLESCLRDRAATVAAPTGFPGQVYQRAKVLRRRRHAVAVVATAPVTAGVVVGAIAVTGSHRARPAALIERPAASASPSANPTAQSTVDVRSAIDICTSGQVPHLTVTGPADNFADPRTQFQPSAAADDIVVARILGPSQIVVDGAPSDTVRYFALLDVHRSGPSVANDWLLGVEPSTGIDAATLSLATFDGCVSPN